MEAVARDVESDLSAQTQKKVFEKSFKTFLKKVLKKF